MRDEGTSQMLVMLLRFIAAREIQRRADFFAPFILGMSDDYVTVDQFCNKSGVHRRVEAAWRSCFGRPGWRGPRQWSVSTTVLCSRQTLSDVQAPSNVHVVYVRLLTSDPAPDYLAVMVMGEESDHIHIVALSDALSVPLSVIYLDGNPMGAFAAGDATGGGVTVAQHDFVPEGCTAGPLFSLLYRPGHYDILVSVGVPLLCVRAKVCECDTSLFGFWRAVSQVSFVLGASCPSEAAPTECSTKRESIVHERPLMSNPEQNEQSV